MIAKQILVPGRVRHPPTDGWSWIDRRFLREHAVILLFLTVTVLAIHPSGLSLVYIVQELITRLGRDSFLVLALLLPIFSLSKAP